MTNTPRRQQIAPTPLAYRIPKAAALIGIAPATLWRKIARGEIEARKIGGATVIRHVDLEAYLNASPVVMPSQKEDNLEAAGVEFIPENGGGAGVRLRKTGGRA